MSLEVIEVETAANPTATVLWMHGLGADGQDFVPVAQELSLAAVGPVRFVFPNAPVIPVTLNGGYPMPAWYDILGAELTQRQDEQGMRRTQGAINTLIARETARGIAASRIVVAGFSQGCAMALMTGLRYPERLAGIMGLSGYLPLLATLAAERSPANHGLPVFLGHGRRDGMVPLAAGAATRDALTALGYPVDWHEYDMEHSVCMEEIADINRWLLRVLA
ncbi:MAG: carboxylesterase [Polaromonas sp.]|nr:carboxylesterase [Polaromonas sp.]MDO9479766.1 carboxylesterase [Hydrogenophaga sp.]